jgi:aminopeptidase N
LEWFFKEWVYGINRPAYEYTWSVKRNDRKSTVKLLIKQTQTNPDLFQMPIDVIVKTEAGERRFVAWQKSKSQSFEFLVEGVVKEVKIDPDGWILKNVKDLHIAPKSSLDTSK